MTTHVRTAAPAAVLLALSALGCSEHDRSGVVAFRLSSHHAPPGTAPPPATGASTRLFAAGDSAVVTLGHDSVIVRRVQLILKEIQLAPKGGGECDPEEDEDQCAPLEPGPVLMRLPLGNAAESMLTTRAPADTYIVFHFAIYKPIASQDGAFLAAHPDFAGTSIRVEGSFSRSGKRGAFVYTSDFNEQEETGLLPALIVPSGATANLTLRMDLATWFLNADKTALIDPSTANPGRPNQHLVKDNIRTSVAAFRDDERTSPRVAP